MTEREYNSYIAGYCLDATSFIPAGSTLGSIWKREGIPNLSLRGIPGGLYNNQNISTKNLNIRFEVPQ